MNHEKKEQAAREWANSNTVEITESYAWQRAKFGFMAGATWREQQAASVQDNDLFNQLISEWSEKYKQLFAENNDEFLGHTALYFFKKGRQASVLHSVKLLAEKDAEIERLRKERLELLEYKFMYEQLCK